MAKAKELIAKLEKDAADIQKRLAEAKQSAHEEFRGEMAVSISALKEKLMGYGSDFAEMVREELKPLAGLMGTKGKKGGGKKSTVQLTEGEMNKFKAALTGDWQDTSDLAEAAGLPTRTAREAGKILVANGKAEKKLSPKGGPWPMFKKA